MEAGFSKTIGILGGVGPAATAYAFQRLVSQCQNEHGAVQDSDFPNVIVLNLPLAGVDERGFDDAPATKEELGRQLNLGYDAVQRVGADIVYLACNTLHSYEAVQGRDKLEAVNIVEVAASYAKNHYPEARVAVLSSEATRREGLYKTTLTTAGLVFHEVSDDTQGTVDELILAAMAGQELEGSRQRLRKTCDDLLSDADCVVLGCTELSLLARQAVIEENNIIDAQEIALQELLKGARHEI